ncbi:MAG: HsdM family class I SAM-dependent methyltransferase, partial [Pyrinomonadaceae bacterium]
MRRPGWFSNGQVFVSYAATCGINKDGQELYKVDPTTGLRTSEIDDELRRDVRAAIKGRTSETSRWVAAERIRATNYVVPAYYDDRLVRELEDDLLDTLPGFTAARLGQLAEEHTIQFRHGHGSPSADMRRGDVPYIKVSDLRAGQVNINPTNRVPRVVAERFWRGQTSGLRAYDLLTPLRASKNIGEFCVVMPGQEELVLTKEILVLRPSADADFGSLYLAWAMSLRIVRQQWSRIVFMQTNREDAGTRYNDIVIPVPPNRAAADEVSAAFRKYY